jgi:D-alanine transfer protein
MTTRERVLALRDRVCGTDEIRDTVLKQRGSLPDAEVKVDLRNSPEWERLDLLLEVLNELGARPLLMSVPMKGAYYDPLGVSPAVRTEASYERLRAVDAAHRVPLACSEDHVWDTRFTMDAGDRPSPKGWAICDRTVDASSH